MHSIPERCSANPSTRTHPSCQNRKASLQEWLQRTEFRTHLPYRRGQYHKAKLSSELGFDKGIFLASAPKAEISLKHWLCDFFEDGILRNYNTVPIVSFMSLKHCSNMMLTVTAPSVHMSLHELFLVFSYNKNVSCWTHPIIRYPAHPSSFGLIEGGGRWPLDSQEHHWSCG